MACGQSSPIVRLKRKINEEAPPALLVSFKRQRLTNSKEHCDHDYVLVEEVYRLAKTSSEFASEMPDSSSPSLSAKRLKCIDLPEDVAARLINKNENIKTDEIKNNTPVSEEDAIDFVYHFYLPPARSNLFRSENGPLIGDEDPMIAGVQLYDELVFDDPDQFREKEDLEDSSDSNDENNWRNEYPEEDSDFENRFDFYADVDEDCEEADIFGLAQVKLARADESDSDRESLV